MHNAEIFACRYKFIDGWEVVCYNGNGEIFLKFSKWVSPMGCLENEERSILMMTVEYYGYVYDEKLIKRWTIGDGEIE